LFLHSHFFKGANKAKTKRRLKLGRASAHPYKPLPVVPVPHANSLHIDSEDVLRALDEQRKNFPGTPPRIIRDNVLKQAGYPKGTSPATAKEKREIDRVIQQFADPIYEEATTQFEEKKELGIEEVINFETRW
jgi:hypothetical protein